MKKRHYLEKTTKLFVTITLFVLLLKKINIEDLVNTMRTIKKGRLLILISIYTISVGLNAAKWKILLPNITFIQLNKTCFKAQFYSMILPGQLFGEASKVLDLKKAGESQGKIASSVIIDKITSLIGTIVIGIIGIIFTSIKIPKILRVLFWIMLFMLLILIMSGKFKFVNTIVTYCSYFLWKNHSIPTIKRIGRQFYKLYIIWKNYSEMKIVLIQSVFMGIINQVIGVFQVWMIANSVEVKISFVEFCWIIPAVSLILLLPISFGGLGVREISLTGFLALFKIASEKAITISFISLLSHFVSAIIGSFAIMYDGLIKVKRN